MKSFMDCPECGTRVQKYRNPTPTTDIVFYVPERGVLLIERKNPPYGWALPGGFIDYGESAEDAAVREAKEETGLDVRIRDLLGVYSEPDRDPRQHTLSVVYVVEADDVSALQAGDDAGKAEFFPLDQLPQPVAFDHIKILEDFGTWLKSTL